jgi:CBS domain-containing protein
MLVRDAMSTDVLTIGPQHTLREAAVMMAARRVGAVVVSDPDQDGPGILTERDILNSLGAREDPDRERADDHKTGDLVYAAPDWDLGRAAAAMVNGGFRHLVVLDRDEVVGMLAMRDIVRVWSGRVGA